MVGRTILALGLLVGCSQDSLDALGPKSETSSDFFRCFVQPELAKGCAFMDCHGNQDRPLRIYAEQRYRLGIDWIDYETPLTDEELAANLATVRGFVDSNLLFDKPLDTRAGGLYHGAVGLYGPSDVFADTDDTGYIILRDFASGASAASCSPGDEYP